MVTVDDVLSTHESLLAAQNRVEELAAQRDASVRYALDHWVSATELADALGLTCRQVYGMALRNDKAAPTPKRNA